LTLLILYSDATNAEHPDMVQEFMSKTQNSRSVMLEWKPPRKPGVFHYKVRSCPNVFLNSKWRFCS